MRQTQWAVVHFLVMVVAVGGLFAGPASAVTLNIEIDYMVLRDQNNNILHSHQPSQAEVNAVIQMFACHGITLNAVIDDEIPHVNVIPDNPGNDKTIFGFSLEPNSQYLMKLAYFDNAGGPWHYCIFGHQYQLEGATTGSSGLAERPGDDLVVTLGSFSGNIGTPFDRASTLAHEFGHNLGLRHSGAMDEDLVGPGNIVMPSVMTYNFQLDGVRTNLLCLGLTQEAANLFKEIDYSEGRACGLIEAGLSEAFGNGMRQLDWNCDGVISGSSSRSLTNVYKNDTWCGAGAGANVLADYNEWGNLVDVTFLADKRLIDDAETSPPCISYEEVVALRQKREESAAGACPQPTLTTEGCIGGDFVFLNPTAGSPSSGTCSSPHPTLGTAATLSPNGSVLYLKYGTYTEPGGDLILSKPMVITSVGSAVVTTASAPNAAVTVDTTSTEKP